ncbi:MAG: hypothetical protein V4636_17050 [Pseudomonadota bacterium]
MPLPGPEQDVPQQDDQSSVSVWRRFWLPYAYLDPLPPRDAPAFRHALRRNARWLDAHLAVYLKRWAVVWLATQLGLALAERAEADLIASVLAICGWVCIGFIVNLGTALIQAKRLLAERRET